MKIISTLTVLFFTFELFAIKSSDSLLKVWNNPNENDSLRIVALSQYGFSLIGNDIDSADKVFSMLLDIAIERDEKWIMARALRCKAIVNVHFDNFSESITYALKALDIAKEINDSSTFLTANIYAGNAYFYMGQYPFALKAWKSALKYVSISENPKNMATSIRGNIANIYAMQDEYEKAIVHYKKMIKIGKDISVIDLLSMNGNIGYAYNQLNKYDSALKYTNLTIQIAERNNIVSMLGNCYINLAEVYLKMNAYDLALNALKKIDFENLTDRDRTEYLINYGNILLALNDYSAANIQCLKALNVANKAHLLKEKKKACECVYKSFKKLNQGSKALEYHELMLSYLDSLNMEDLAKKIQHYEISNKLLKDSLQKQEELKLAKIEKEKTIVAKTRKNRIQYSLAVIVVLILATAIAIVTRFKISTRLASGLIFIFFILTFEFLLVVLDPWVDSISNGEVGWKIIINTAIALVLFGIHQVSEKRLKNAILKADK